MKIIVLLIIAISVCSESSAQTTLFLGNPGKKRILYFTGDSITLVYHNNVKASGRIRYMLKDKIGVDDRVFYLDSIKKIILPGHYLSLRRMGINLIVSTLSLLTLDILNRKINRGEPAFDAQNLGVTTVLLSLGTILLPWNDKKIRVTDRRPLKVIDFD